MNAFRVFGQQFTGLLHKNSLLSIRRKRATFLYLFSSFFFILLLYAVDRSVQFSFRSATAYKTVRNPQPVQVLPIVPCETAYFMHSPCYDFVWSGNSSIAVDRIVEGIKRNNPGRPIPDSKVLSFGTPAEVDQWFLANRLRSPGALHFQQRAGTNVIAYGVQTNSTVKTIRGQFEDWVFKFQIPLQAAAEREIVRFATGDPSIGWNISFVEFAHPAKKLFSTVGTLGPTFLLAAAMFGLVIQLGNLVAEKELKLRQFMSVMGLMDSAYWLSWLTWGIILTLISALALIISGLIFQMNFFLDNNFGVLFFLFFLFQLNLVGFAFFISNFVRRASSANTVGFIIYIIGFITQLVTTFGFPYDRKQKKAYWIIWSFFPPNLFALGLKYLGDATSSGYSGVSWSGIKDCPPGNSGCVLTFEGIYKWLIATFFLWFLLALYFDNVLPDVNGVRKPWYYFLTPAYWKGSGIQTSTSDRGWFRSRSSRAGSVEEEFQDDNVAAEEAFVRSKSIDDPNTAVQVHGLVKTFPGTSSRRGCCKGRAPPQLAVAGTWFSIEKDKLFCLLGANGAGKTTTINCLTGIIPVSGGDAFVYGESIKNSESMGRIRKYMGVCPQFDILWDVLTGREHLYLFARIKGLSSKVIRSEVEKMLCKVDLLEAGNTRSASYSGGMKRRLSLAVALIGGPRILYLDEPTTGMDPIMRRSVWKIIEEAKTGCAIILTTHSMEEADVLADRIAIMAKGKLQCIGTSIHLKTKFGAGYKITVGVRTQDSPDEDDKDVANRKMAVKAFFHEHLNIEPCEESEADLTFAIPSDAPEEELANFFEELRTNEEVLDIVDTQLGLTTLEEVFLTIAKQAELRSSEGRLERLQLEDGTVLMVPLGTERFHIPGTESQEHPRGMMVEISWHQDEYGRLCISDHSELKPVD